MTAAAASAATSHSIRGAGVTNQQSFVNRMEMVRLPADRLAGAVVPPLRLTSARKRAPPSLDVMGVPESPHPAGDRAAAAIMHPAAVSIVRTRRTQGGSLVDKMSERRDLAPQDTSARQTPTTQLFIDANTRHRTSQHPDAASASESALAVLDHSTHRAALDVTSQPVPNAARQSIRDMSQAGVGTGQASNLTPRIAAPLEPSAVEPTRRASMRRHADEAAATGYNGVVETAGIKHASLPVDTETAMRIAEQTRFRAHEDAAGKAPAVLVYEPALMPRDRIRAIQESRDSQGAPLLTRSGEPRTERAQALYDASSISGRRVDVDRLVDGGVRAALTRNGDPRTEQLQAMYDGSNVGNRHIDRTRVADSEKLARAALTRPGHAAKREGDALMYMTAADMDAAQREVHGSNVGNRHIDHTRVADSEKLARAALTRPGHAAKREGDALMYMTAADMDAAQREVQQTVDREDAVARSQSASRRMRDAQGRPQVAYQAAGLSVHPPPPLAGPAADISTRSAFPKPERYIDMGGVAGAFPRADRQLGNADNRVPIEQQLALLQAADGIPTRMDTAAPRPRQRVAVSDEQSSALSAEQRVLLQSTQSRAAAAAAAAFGDPTRCTFVRQDEGERGEQLLSAVTRAPMPVPVGQEEVAANADRENAIARTTQASRKAGSTRGYTFDLEDRTADDRSINMKQAPPLSFPDQARWQHLQRRTEEPRRAAPTDHPQDATEHAPWRRLNDVTREQRPTPTRLNDTVRVEERAAHASAGEEQTLANATGKAQVLEKILRSAASATPPVNSRDAALWPKPTEVHARPPSEDVRQAILATRPTPSIDVETHLTRTGLDTDAESRKASTERAARDLALRDDDRHRVHTESWVRGGVDTRAAYKVPATYIKS